jgi:hypothetical protein
MTPTPKPRPSSVDPYGPKGSDPACNREVRVGLTAKEVQTVVAALAGQFPESLNAYRWELLTKLAKAKYQHELGLPDA